MGGAVWLVTMLSEMARPKSDMAKTPMANRMRVMLHRFWR